MLFWGQGHIWSHYGSFCARVKHMQSNQWTGNESAEDWICYSSRFILKMFDFVLYVFSSHVVEWKNPFMPHTNVSKSQMRRELRKLLRTVSWLILLSSSLLDPLYHSYHVFWQIIEAWIVSELVVSTFNCSQFAVLGINAGVEESTPIYRPRVVGGWGVVEGWREVEQMCISPGWYFRHKHKCSDD